LELPYILNIKFLYSEKTDIIEFMYFEKSILKTNFLRKNEISLRESVDTEKI